MKAEGIKMVEKLVRNSVFNFSCNLVIVMMGILAGAGLRMLIQDLI
jgi:hypothetical protein